jgi:hypothetical protein
MRTVLFLLCIIAFALVLAWFWPAEWNKQQDVALMPDDTLATITRILQQDKKECRLLDAWPDAPLVMLDAARKYKIDAYLLPCISRAEGPTPSMLAACNVYGLEWHGELIEFVTHYHATDAAAALLAKHQPTYQSTGLVDIPKLAGIWCPANRELWAGNMAKIYERGLCSTTK